jgi:hypothetical protein
MDFGFFNVPSLRGFQSFLVIVEAVTSLHPSLPPQKQEPPIALWIWFRVKTYGVPAPAWRTDNGGKLWEAQSLELLPHRNIAR